jgi:hypothetical protein
VNARASASRVADELNRRGVPVVTEQHNTSTLAAIHHPYLDGPTAFILVIGNNSSSWHAAERTAIDEYAAVPSRLDNLPDGAPTSDVADAIQHCLDNRLPRGSDPVATIDELRANHPRAKPTMLLVLRGDASTSDAIAARWTESIAGQFNRTICIDASHYQTTRGLRIRKIIEDVLPILGSPLPEIADTDDGYASALRLAYIEATTRNAPILVHLHNATEPAQTRWLQPTAPGSVLLITTRQSFRELALDDAYFLDV